MTAPSPHVPIERSLETLSDAIDYLWEASSVCLESVDTEWKLYKPTSVEAVTESFQELGEFIKSEIARNQDVSSPVREIQAVSAILGQITHHIGNLNKKLAT